MRNTAIKFIFESGDGVTLEQIVVLEAKSDAELSRRAEEYFQNYVSLNPEYRLKRDLQGSVNDAIQSIPDGTVIWHVYAEPTS